MAMGGMPFQTYFISCVSNLTYFHIEISTLFTCAAWSISREGKQGKREWMPRPQLQRLCSSWLDLLKTLFKACWFKKEFLHVESRYQGRRYGFAKAPLLFPRPISGTVSALEPPAHPQPMSCLPTCPFVPTDNIGSVCMLWQTKASYHHPAQTVFSEQAWPPDSRVPAPT